MAGRPKEFERAEALEKAMDLFWRNGYDGASLSQLVDAMGVGRQSAYDTFGGKRKLFLAALEAYTERAMDLLKSVLTEGPSPLGRVRKFLLTITEIANSGDGIGCLFTNSMVELGPHDPRIRKAISAIWGKLEDALAANLEAAVEAGEVRESLEPRGTARLLVMVMQGAQVLSKAKQPGRVADAMRTMEAMILR